jgi:cytochrome P450
VNTLKDIPQLSGATLAGHAGAFRTDRLGLFLNVQRECGGIGRLRFFNLPVVVVSSPDALHEILVEKSRSFAKSAGIRLAVYPLAGNGLFTSDGELWRRQRKLMSPLFQPARILDYAPGMNECILRVVSSFREGEEIDVGREMTRITMSVVGKALFDSDTFDETDDLGAAITTILEWVASNAGGFSFLLKMQAVIALENLEGRLPEALDRSRGALLQRMQMPMRMPTEHSRKLYQAFHLIHDKVQRMIDERRSVGLSRPDLLTKLLTARDEDDGQGMSDQQVRDEVLTLFFAGHETTAVGATWALYLLSQHPEVYERHKAEVDSLGGRIPGVEDLPKLGYTLRIFKEALRLYPPAAMFDRVAKEDVEIGGYLVPKGTTIFISPYAIQRNAALWPDPERFDPDRFLPEAEEARPRLAYLPFGGGPRICIGLHFALLEGQLLLALLAQRIRIEPQPGLVLKPSNLATFRPDPPLMMRVHLRN